MLSRIRKSVLVSKRPGPSETVGGMWIFFFSFFSLLCKCVRVYVWLVLSSDLSHHAPLWTCWCHSLTFTNTSTSSQSQLTTSYHHHHHNNHQDVQYRLGTHIHWCAAEAKFEVTAGGTVRSKWVNGCFWCWNMLFFFSLLFLFKTLVLPRSGGRSVSWNTAEAYFQEARLF